MTKYKGTAFTSSRIIFEMEQIFSSREAAIEAVEKTDFFKKLKTEYPKLCAGAVTVERYNKLNRIMKGV